MSKILRSPAGPTPVRPSPVPLSPVRLAPVKLGDEATFDEGLAALASIDAPFMAAFDAVARRPSLRQREPGFEGLVWIVVSQQVSTAAANAIFGRLKARLGRIDAGAIRENDDETLKCCGLSAPKLRTIRALAEATHAGQLDFETLATAKIETARTALCAVKGIGPWTADIFLLFCLGHADAWPVGDLALQEAARLILGLERRPDAKALDAIGERWRPLRGVAAHCLWAYYHVARGRAAPLADAAAAPKRARRRTT